MSSGFRVRPVDSGLRVYKSLLISPRTLSLILHRIVVESDENVWGSTDQLAGQGVESDETDLSRIR